MRSFHFLPFWRGTQNVVSLANL